MTNQSPLQKSTDIDYKLLDRIIGGMDLDKMDMWQVIKRVYEAVYLHYSFMYHEAKAEEDHIYKKVLEKNAKIEELEDEITTLRICLSEEVIEEATKTSQ